LKYQLALIASSFTLVIVLFVFGRNTPLKKTDVTTLNVEGENFNINDYLDFNKNKLLIIPKDSVNLLESLVSKRKPDSLNISYLKQIADIYKNNGKFAVASEYFKRIAKIDSTAKRWETAGDALFEAFTINQDSIVVDYLLQNSVEAYQTSIDLDSTNLKVPVKLAEVLIDGTNNTMAGVTMLLDVVKKDPDNIRAGLTLGRLSLVSGQFDKAIKRLEHVLKIEPKNTEAMLYLAGVYEQNGEKVKAVEYYERCRDLSKNPETKQKIDIYLQKLK